MTAWHHFAVSGVETWLWLPPLAALVIVFFTSMIGISGAFLLVPFQLSVLGFASPAASATNLVFNLVAIPGAILRYARENRLLWPLALIIAAGGAPGTLAGAWLRPLAGRARLVRALRRRHPRLSGLAHAGRLAAQRHAGSACGHGAAAGGGLARDPLRPWRDDACLSGSADAGSDLRRGVIGIAYGIGGGSFMVPLCLVVSRLPPTPGCRHRRAWRRVLTGRWALPSAPADWPVPTLAHACRNGGRNGA